MNTTIKVTGFIYARQMDYAANGRKRGDIDFTVLGYANADPKCLGACLGPVAFDYAMPEGVDVESATTRALIRALEAEKDEATRRFTQEIASINERLSKLQAITCEVAA